MKEGLSRRAFVVALGAVFTPSARLLAADGYDPPRHPEPRPGIDAKRILTRDQLGSDAESIRIFDLVREIPQIVDGIYCYCGCEGQPEHYSPLSCFESDGMARYCVVCSGEGELVHQLHRKGQTLDQIRAAIDKRFS